MTAEYALSYVAGYEECMMRMIAKNERLCGRLDECEKKLGKSVCMTERPSFAMWLVKVCLV